MAELKSRLTINMFEGMSPWKHTTRPIITTPSPLPAEEHTIFLRSPIPRWFVM